MAADKLLPPADLIAFVGGGTDLEAFQHIGDHFLGHFVTLGGLRPDHRVLDVGSGIGRMALPLTRYLGPRGSYEGFDVVPHGVDWCRANITPRHPNFRFQLADVHNDIYNPAGRHRARVYRFPFLAGEFDFVFLTSVFTHLLPRDLTGYLGEVARVLKPGGRCLITYFLHGPETAANVRAGRSVFKLPLRYGKPSLPEGSAPEYGDCLTETAEEIERVVAYDERWALDQFRAVGLAADRPVYGHWSGRPGPCFQDIVTATKVGGPSLAKRVADLVRLDGLREWVWRQRRKPAGRPAAIAG